MTDRSNVLRWLLLLVCLCTGTASASIAILYPQTREPYRSVFTSIIKGIEDRVGTRIVRYELKQDASIAEVNGWLAANDIEGVIALGTSGLQVARQLPETMPVLIGAVLIDQTYSDRFSGITLATDPTILFARLRSLAPRIRTLTVVYNPERNEWLIERARVVAQQQGVVLRALPAEDLSASATIYRETLQKLESGSDAIWLLQDRSTLDDHAILPLILAAAWDKNLVVVSSNPAHVKKGALFSLYPDNIAMGRRLGTLVSTQISDRAGVPAGMSPLEDVLIAVNLRTADHLGLDLRGRANREFDLTYP